jgi:23S rRNA (cytidine1920-2'-O)/16S rRNA (cytidine1409-2'-O)-methyltransferase
VGHDQLDRSLRGRDDLRVLEGVNARDLTPAALEGLTGIAERPTLVVGDLSFISLRTVLPALESTADPDADFVLLIKPQFEVGRGNVKEGIVHNPGLREDAVANVAWAAWDLGLGTVGLLPSPIVGTNGNHEYLIRLSRSAGVNPTQWVDMIATMTRGS